MNASAMITTLKLSTNRLVTLVIILAKPAMETYKINVNFV
jgi:hypothetical protein